MPAQDATTPTLGAFILLKRKRDSLGEIVSYKSSFCIKGNEQVDGENDDYFASVCNQKTLFMVIALSAVYDLELLQIDGAIVRDGDDRVLAITKHRVRNSGSESCATILTISQCSLAAVSVIEELSNFSE